MAFGEAGSLTANSPAENTPITVNLTEPLTNPVFALSATNNGGNPFNLRVVSQTLDGDGNTTAFSFIIEEWEYLDGPHGAVETINWLAVEEGVHTLPDGRIVEAGTVQATNTNSAVSLNGGFTDPPVVLTSVMSENDLTAVDSDPVSIASTGFNVRLQEEEGEDGIHPAETVGYIAIEAGGSVATGIASTVGGVDENTDIISLGGVFTDAVSLVETQTINGGDPGNLVLVNPGNSDTGVFFQEEQSSDNETGHVNETIGLITFEDGLLVCFCEGTRIETLSGALPVEDLQSGMCVRTLGSGYVPLRRLLCRKVDAAELRANPRLRPICIEGGALGQGLPHRDLCVSPQHRMLVHGPVAERMFAREQVLVSAHNLTALPGINRVDDLAPASYYHLVFDRHQVIFAEAAPTESLLLGEEVQKGLPPALVEELAALFPQASQPAGTAPPARFIPRNAAQKRLARRLAQNRKSVLGAGWSTPPS